MFSRAYIAKKTSQIQKGKMLKAIDTQDTDSILHMTMNGQEMVYTAEIAVKADTETIHDLLMTLLTTTLPYI